MTDTLTLDPRDRFGELLAADTVRLERLLPGPIERLWRYLTDSELRAQWLAAGGGTMGLEPGGRVELVFRNSSLTPGDDEPPQKYAGEHSLRGRVTACDPPRLLAFTWGDGESPSEVRFDLTPQGEQVLLVVTHSRLSSRDGLMGVSTGWHTHLALLRARLEGGDLPYFWRTFRQVKAEYEKRLGAPG